MKLLKSATAPLALLLCITLFSASLWADSKPSPKVEQNHQLDRFDMMALRLKLDNRQKTQLKDLVEKLQQKREQSMKQLEEDEQQELARLLDADQIKTVQRYLKYAQRGPITQSPQARPPEETRKPRSYRGLLPKPPENLPKTN